MNEALCDISDKIKSECKRENAKLSSTLSTRILIEAAEMIIDGFDLGEIFNLETVLIISIATASRFV